MSMWKRYFYKKIHDIRMYVLMHITDICSRASPTYLAPLFGLWCRSVSLRDVDTMCQRTVQSKQLPNRCSDYIVVQGVVALL